MRRWIAPAAVAGVVGVYATLVRPRIRTLGATPEEVERPLPGDELIGPVPSRSTMATTIAAPPEEVWPWLVQMGLGRAGWYSFDRLDMFGQRSLDRLVPELQQLTAGDRLPSSPNGETWFDVDLLEPERVLGLVSRLDLRRMRPYAAGESRPRWWSEGAWVFVLEPVAEGTRLLVRSFGRSSPAFPFGVIDRVFWEPAHVVMQLRQFHGLRRRVEAARRAGGAAGSTDETRMAA